MSPQKMPWGVKECETKGDAGQGSGRVVSPTAQSQESKRLVTCFDNFLVKFDSMSCLKKELFRGLTCLFNYQSLWVTREAYRFQQ